MTEETSRADTSSGSDMGSTHDRTVRDARRLVILCRPDQHNPIYSPLRHARSTHAMTTIYDPMHPLYSDEADVRNELSRVFDVCQGCRRCVTLCSSFPTLFEMLDRFDDHDAGRMTPAQQDQVVGECFQCKLCSLGCPYIPPLHELSVDFPRLMLRAGSMQYENGHTTSRTKVAAGVIGRTDLVGKLATSASSIANRIVSAEPESFIRRMNAKVTGVSAVRLLAPYAKERFSTWFEKRPRIKIGKRQGSVTVYPTCLVEYHETAIGKDLVKVYERNGIECEISKAGCCGAPMLHAGDVKRFTKVAKKNVKMLAAEIRRGTDLVVAQPTCSYVLKRDYIDYVGGADAELVAEHTYDASEYLMKVHRADDTVLDTDFEGELHRTITYHTPCHLRAQRIGFTSRDMMKLTGARVRLVQQCAGIDGLWGLRDGHEHVSLPIGEKLGAEIEIAGGEVVAGDCLLANTVIVEQTGRPALHPLQVIARAYGIPQES
jgi:glycerol-3-phosphate dehydrogenase subunit C